MKSILIKLLVPMLGLLLAPASHAVLIDFEGLPGVTPVAGNITPLAIIDDEFASQGVIFGRAGVSAGVGIAQSASLAFSGANAALGLNVAGIAPGPGPGCCLGDIYFNFLGTTDFVSFAVGDIGGDNDIFEIRTYDLSDTLIDLQNLSGESFVEVTIAMAGIHRVEILLNPSVTFGYGLDDLEFNDVVGANPVPVPGVIGLMLIGLLGLRKFRA